MFWKIWYIYTHKQRKNQSKKMTIVFQHGEAARSSQIIDVLVSLWGQLTGRPGRSGNAEFGHGQRHTALLSRRSLQCWRNQRMSSIRLNFILSVSIGSLFKLNFTVILSGSTHKCFSWTQCCSWTWKNGQRRSSAGGRRQCPVRQKRHGGEMWAEWTFTCTDQTKWV